MPLKLKPENASVVIGFNHSSAPLGSRTDLVKLYEMGKANNDQSILGLFDDLPTEKEVVNLKETAFNEKQRTKNP